MTPNLPWLGRVAGCPTLLSVILVSRMQSSSSSPRVGPLFRWAHRLRSTASQCRFTQELVPVGPLHGVKSSHPPPPSKIIECERSRLSNPTARASSPSLFFSETNLRGRAPSVLAAASLLAARHFNKFTFQTVQLAHAAIDVEAIIPVVRRPKGIWESVFKVVRTKERSRCPGPKDAKLDQRLRPGSLRALI